MNKHSISCPVIENWAAFASESNDARVQNMYSDFKAVVIQLQAQVASLQREAHTWSSTLETVLKEQGSNEPQEKGAGAGAPITRTPE